jgi:hypothetical protein
MNQSDDQIKLDIVNEISSIEGLLTNLSSDGSSDSLIEKSYSQIKTAINLIKTSLPMLNSRLPLSTELADLYQKIKQVTWGINKLANEKNETTSSHLDMAICDVEYQIIKIVNLIKTEEKFVDELQKINLRYEEQSSNILSELKIQVNQIDADRKNLQNQINQLINERNLLQAQIDGFKTELLNEKQRTDSIVSDMQKQFLNAQQSRQDEATSQLTQLRNKLEESASLSLTELEKHKKAAEKIVGLISIESMAHGYKEIADKQQKISTTWQWITAGSLILWIGFGGWFFYSTYQMEVSPITLVRQFFISIPFVLLSGFASLQVSKHQDAEKTNRQQQLELAAIDPYLASLDDAERNKIKTDLTHKFFGQRDDKTLKVESTKIIDSLTDMPKLIKSVNEIKESIMAFAKK